MKKSVYTRNVISISLGTLMVIFLLSFVLFPLLKVEFPLFLQNLSLVALILFISSMFGLIYSEDFYKDFSGEIIDDYEKINWWLSKSIWLFVLIVQILFFSFDILVASFLKDVLKNYGVSDLSWDNVGNIYFLTIFLPTLFFVFRSHILRARHNELDLLKVKRRAKIMDYADSNKLDKINYVEWITKDDNLQKDKELMLKILKDNGAVLYLAHESLKRDKEVVLTAIKESFLVLKFADDSLKKDKGFVIEALKNSRFPEDTLKDCDETLKKDPDILEEIERLKATNDQ
jgi:hypothetical protein